MLYQAAVLSLAFWLPYANIPSPLSKVSDADAEDIICDGICNRGGSIEGTKKAAIFFIIIITDRTNNDQ